MQNQAPTTNKTTRKAVLFITPKGIFKYKSASVLLIFTPPRRRNKDWKSPAQNLMLRAGPYRQFGKVKEKLSPRRGATHAVQLTPHKPSGAVWWMRILCHTSISERCDRRCLTPVKYRMSPTCTCYASLLSPHYAPLVWC